ncbi:MAG: ATP-binding cassette domain-containing protein [Ignavibacteria bacterium]|jgi:ATPase subunit of ABC transporter with duplicated ATPase domains
MLLSVKNISKSFENLGKKIKILKGISFDVEFKNRIAITGRNGTGKSTLLRIIAKELIPDAGEVQMNEDINYVYLAQSTSDYTAPNLTVLEHISLGLLKNSISNVKKLLVENKIERIRNIFDKYNIPLKNRLNTFVGNLSGGERQLVAISTIVALKPQLFLLDEFTASLDPATTEIMVNTLVEYQKYNQAAIIFVSHDRTLIKSFCTGELSLDSNS